MRGRKITPARSALAGAVATTVLLCAPRIAAACPVCFSATEKTRSSFMITTVLLTLLPLIAVGSLLLLYRRRVRALQRLARLADATPTTPADPPAGAQESAPSPGR